MGLSIKTRMKIKLAMFAAKLAIVMAFRWLCRLPGRIFGSLKKAVR